MLLLAIDTSGRNGSLALARGNALTTLKFSNCCHWRGGCTPRS